MKNEINYNQINLFGIQIQVDLFGSIEADKATILKIEVLEYVDVPNNLFDKQTTISFKGK